MTDRQAKKTAKEEAKEARRRVREELREQRREAQAVLSRPQIADQLRALASQVEGGTFVLGDKEVALPDSAEFEIAYKVKRRGKQQIEVEIEWGGATTAPLLPTR